MENGIYTSEVDRNAYVEIAFGVWCFIESWGDVKPERAEAAEKAKQAALWSILVEHIGIQFEDCGSVL